MTVALLHTLIRPEEKLLLQALQDRDVDHVTVDVRERSWTLDDLDETPDWTVAIDRVLSQHQALAVADALQARGIPVVNPPATIRTCGDKWRTSLALADAGVPTPDTRVAFDRDAALEAADELGYPVVVKPTTGSWGRMLAKCNDRQALEGVIEHKDQLGGQHQVIYLQEHVDKEGGDVRAFVVGDEVVCAIHRASDHWITNTARGAKASDQPLTDDLVRTSRAAADAVGGHVLAVDLLPTDDGFLVHEVNHTTEFRNSIETTGVDIPDRIVDHLLEVAR